MRAAFIAPTGNANSRSEQPCGFRRTSVRAIAAVMRKLHELYPDKTAANIAARAKVSVRAAEHWIAKDEAIRRDMSLPAFLELLLSEDGGALLEAAVLALPPRERPRWWQRHSNTARMAMIEETIAAAEEEQRQLRLDLARRR